MRRPRRQADRPTKVLLDRLDDPIDLLQPEDAGSLFRQSSGVALAKRDKPGTILATESLAGLHESLAETACDSAVRKEDTRP